MSEQYRNIFISSVTADHQDLRLQIAENLRSPERNMLVQESLHGKGRSLIETLQDLVKKADLVVHLIGPGSGYSPEELPVRELVEHLETTLSEQQRLSRRFPEIYHTLRDFPKTFSYTQWECWLAILHGIDCLIIRDQAAFPRGLDDLSLVDFKQRRHIERLTEIGHDMISEFDGLHSACNVVLQFESSHYRWERSSLAIRMRIARYFGRSCWALGEWQKAQIECSRLTSLLTEGLIEESQSDDDRVDVLQFLMGCARLSTLAASDKEGYNHAEELLGRCDGLMPSIESAVTVSLAEKVAIRAELTIVRSRLLDAMGLSPEAVRLVKSFAQISENRKNVSIFRAARLQNEIGICTWHLGRLDEAVTALSEAAKLFESIDNSLWLGGVLTNLGFVQTDKGNYSKATEYCERAHRLHGKVGNKAWELTNLGAWGMALVFSGRIDEGIERLNTALEGTATNDLETAAQFRGEIARALLHRGYEQDLDVAIIHLEQAVARQSDGNRASRRLFGNRVLMSLAYQRAGRTKSEVTEAIRLAYNDAKAIGLSADTPVLQVRRDFTLLNSVAATWNEGELPA